MSETYQEHLQLSMTGSADRGMVDNLLGDNGPLQELGHSYGGMLTHKPAGLFGAGGGMAGQESIL